MYGNTVGGTISGNGGICKCFVSYRQKGCRKKNKCLNGRKDFQVPILNDNFAERFGEYVEGGSYVRYTIDDKTRFFFNAEGYTNVRISQVVGVVLGAYNGKIPFDYNFGFLNDVVVFLCTELGINFQIHSVGKCMSRGNRLKEGIDLIFSSLDEIDEPILVELQNLFYSSVLEPDMLDTLRQRLTHYPELELFGLKLLDIASNSMYAKCGFLEAWNRDCDFIHKKLLDKWKLNDSKAFFILEDLEFLVRLFKKTKHDGGCFGNCQSGIVSVVPLFVPNTFTQEKGCLTHFYTYFEKVQKGYELDVNIKCTGIFSKNVVLVSMYEYQRMLEWLDTRRRKFKLVSEDEVLEVRDSLISLCKSQNVEWESGIRIDIGEKVLDRVNIFLSDIFVSKDVKVMEHIEQKLENDKEPIHQLGRVFYSMKEIDTKEVLVSTDFDKLDGDQVSKVNSKGKEHHRRGFQTRTKQIEQRVKHCSCFARLVLICSHKKSTIFRKILTKLFSQSKHDKSFWGWILEYKNTSDKKLSSILQEVIPPEIMERLKLKEMYCLGDYLEDYVDMLWLARHNIVREDNPIFKVFKGAYEGKNIYVYSQVSKYGGGDF